MRLFIFCLISVYNIRALDIFCGQLEVFEQQRFGKNSIAISTQQTSDLKQCLEQCCAVPNCEGVTFGGIIETRGNEPNCLLVGCRNGCQLNPRGDFIDGVISVSLNRFPTSSPTTSSANVSTKQPSDGVTSTTAKPFTTNSTTLPGYGGPFKATVAPAWAVGLAIVIAVVCVGFSLSLVSAYFCWRRRRSKKRSAQITKNTGPTLHAYNLSTHSS